MKPAWRNTFYICIKIVLLTLLVQDANGAKQSSVKLADIFATGLGQPEKQAIIRQEIIQSLHSEGNTILDNLESKDCAGHIREWSVRLGQGGNWYNESSWVPQMIDSWGKVPEGILSGHINALGDFDECINIQVTNLTVTEDDSLANTFKGRYCTSYIVDYNTSMEAAGLVEGSKEKINKLNVFMSHRESEIFQESVTFEELLKLISSSLTQGDGVVGAMLPSVAVCLPSSCSKEDIQYILTTSLHQLYLKNESLDPRKMPFPLVATCEDKSQIQLTAADMIIIIILGGLAALSVTAGAIDCYYQDSTENESDRRVSTRMGNMYQYLMAFSFYTNTKKWLSTRKNSEDFGCLHGIRFLSTCWVILGHGYYVFAAFPVWNTVDVKHMHTTWTMMPILNATFVVDTFFVLSGMLATYGILKLLHKTNGKMNIPMFYLHRYLRLTPAYAIIIGIIATIVVHTGNGPMWYWVEAQTQICKENWWTNLLYVNNLVRTNAVCIGTSWYLANDMQFYLLAPFIVYPLWKWQSIGASLLGVYTVLSWIPPAIVYHYFDVAPGLILTRDVGLKFNNLYQRPWTRIQTFLVGVWLGWILYKTRGKRVVISKWVVTASWIGSACLVLTVIYAIQPWFDPTYEIPRTASYFYASLSRFTFAIGIAWVIFACVKGYGGVINKFLSWSAFMPLGRLTFCAYLVSFHVEVIFHARLSVPMKYDTYTVVNLFFAHIVVSFLLGFFCTIVFESPFIALQKLIFEGPSNPTRHKQGANEIDPSKRYGKVFDTDDSAISVPPAIHQQVRE